MSYIPKWTKYENRVLNSIKSVIDIGPTLPQDYPGETHTSVCGFVPVEEKWGGIKEKKDVLVKTLQDIFIAEVERLCGRLTTEQAKDIEYKTKILTNIKDYWVRFKIYPQLQVFPCQYFMGNELITDTAAKLVAEWMIEKKPGRE